MSADLELALSLAELVAPLSLRRFQSRDYAVRLKPDGSPVTDVDEEVERRLRAAIGQARPGDSILGEEFGRSGDGERCWYLDPIDGTSLFVDGEARWATLIALSERGAIVAGVVDQPALGTRWWAARGEGAWGGDGRLAVSQRSPLAAAIVGADQRNPIERMPTDNPLVRVAAAAERTETADRDAFLAVAAGLADVAIGTRGFEWDLAPYAVILQEAGGRFTDVQGAVRIDSQNAVVSNGLIHDQVLEVLRTPG